MLHLFFALLTWHQARVGPTPIPGQSKAAHSLEFNETNPRFGPVVIGKTSEPKIISVLNVGNSPLFILQIKVTGDFEENNPCPTWLAEGSACLVYITFKPTATGTRIGELYVDAVPSLPPAPRQADVFSQSIQLSGFGSTTWDADDPKTVIPTEASRTTNDEERFVLLNDDKRYSFQALLNGNPPDVANAKRGFALTKDSDHKQRIASILLHIGVKDAAYFDYLAAEAEKALAHDRDIPYPVIWSLPDGATGQEQDSPNPAFVDWCQEHGMEFWEMYRVSVYQIPTAWDFLAAAGDLRSRNLLSRGLRSPNLMIAGSAAHGLARLQDPEVIDELISVGRKSTGHARRGIATALLFFSDDRARRAADELFTSKKMLEIERQEIKTKGFRALFPW